MGVVAHNRWCISGEGGLITVSCARSNLAFQVETELGAHVKAYSLGSMLMSSYIALTLPSRPRAGGSRQTHAPQFPAVSRLPVHTLVQHNKQAADAKYKNGSSITGKS